MAITAATALATGLGAAGLYSAKKDRDAARDSVRSLERQRDLSQEFIERSISQGRQDIFKIIPNVQETIRRGAESGLATFSEAFPAQIEAFQGGNLAAQQTLMAGLPQQQAAILGQPVDFSGLQPYQAPVNFQPTTQMPQGLSTAELFPQPGTTPDAPTFSWSGFINEPGNEDLAQAFRSQNWAATPDQWAEELWLNQASRSGDPRVSRVPSMR